MSTSLLQQINSIVMSIRWILRILLFHRLPGEQWVVAGCDNGRVEMYRVSAQKTVLCETERPIQAHDDMVLGVALLAGGEKTVTVGQDRKSVGNVQPTLVCTCRYPLAEVLYCFRTN